MYVIIISPGERVGGGGGVLTSTVGGGVLTSTTQHNTTHNTIGHLPIVLYNSMSNHNVFLSNHNMCFSLTIICVHKKNHPTKVYNAVILSRFMVGCTHLRCSS
jgi:hypothetical protein